ncbi:ABC transporter ATP-binding protein [Candidatus Poribacteria bacterium]|nr:ABC transporter ATP-binding protein [Candidatus Poribacteria bacterium]
MIKIENLSKEFEGHQVLKGLNLRIEKGETLVVMGRSGCGKSVLLKLIIGLIPPDEGQIWVDGSEITKLNEKQMGAVRRKFGMVFQSAALFDSLTVAENVGFSLSRHTYMSRNEITHIVSEKLELVGLGGTEELMPSELSGGMKKRVSVARAISMNPEIVLYDEPTTGLDPVTSGEINFLIAELYRSLKVTSVVVTHDLKSAFTIATRMAMLHEGKMVAIDTPDEFRKNTEPVIKQFLLNM